MGSARSVGLPSVLLLGLAALGCSRTPAITVQVATQEGNQPAWVQISGLTAEELNALRATVWREEGWRTLLAVTPSGGDGTPLPGRYVTSRDGLEFHPRQPFRPGEAYVVRFDPSRLPTPRPGAHVETTVRLPPRPEVPLARVAALAPSGEEWPANLLRFYVTFSTPMSRTEGAALVRVLDEDGRALSGAVVTSPIDFWSPDRTRYTVFLSTGRSNGTGKSDAVLVPGRTYTVVVDSSWRDAEGRPLAEGYRQTFRAGPAVHRPLVPAEWRVTAPGASTSEPLLATFPHPLDAGLLDRSLAVAPVGGDPLAGTAAVRPGETAWQFTPAAPWQRGSYELLVLSTLEDPAGNRIGRATAAAPPSMESEPPPPETLRLPVVIR